MFEPSKTNKKPILLNPLTAMNFLTKLYQTTIKPSEKIPTIHKQYNNKYN